MNNIVDSINHIIQIIKKEKLNEIIIIIAAGNIISITFNSLLS